ncbi:MAG: dihydrolipoyl dehydrogenase [Anaerolineales bacterium]
MVMGEQTLETQVAVIGGGPGGYAAAFRAADLGLEVTLINEEEMLGGMCLHRGCIPSKALHRTTELIQQARDAKKFGVRFEEPEIDLEGVRRGVERVIKTLARGLAHLAKQREVQVLHGRAVFESSRQLRVRGGEVAHIQFEHAIIATGLHTRPLPGVEFKFKEEGRVMGPGTALHLPEIPETLLVIGGGYSGLEIGSRYAHLGSRVTVVEMLDSLLPGVDPELVNPLEKNLKKLFEAIHLNTTVADLKESDDHVEVTFESDEGEAGAGEESSQTFDRVVISSGSRPNSEGLGLENTKIEVDDDGFIQVDAQQRTADPRIFAVGDVVGGKMLAHKAMYEGKIAAEVIAGEPAAFDARAIPAVVYTDPEVAWCGLSEAEAEEAGYEIEVGRFPWSASGRALTMGSRQGLTKIIFEAETERVLGVGIVGPRAEDLIAEAALAVEMGAVAEDLALTVHAHPTLGETVGGAAEAFLGIPIDILPPRD